LLASGVTNREIAAELHLSTEAIKKHASAIYRKLGVRNRTEASRRARAL
jgi:DNA-binding NarL/FixJ family response regulator